MFSVCSGYAWVRKSNVRLNYGVKQVMQVDYPSQCQMVCRMSNSCNSVNYLPNNMTCQLLTHYVTSSVNCTDLVDANNWEWWTDELTRIV